jgi:hypothetical protein
MIVRAVRGKLLQLESFQQRPNSRIERVAEVTDRRSSPIRSSDASRTRRSIMPESTHQNLDVADLLQQR